MHVPRYSPETMTEKNGMNTLRFRGARDNVGIEPEISHHGEGLEYNEKEPNTGYVLLCWDNEATCPRC